MRSPFSLPRHGVSLATGRLSRDTDAIADTKAPPPSQQAPSRRVHDRDRRGVAQADLAADDGRGAGARAAALSRGYVSSPRPPGWPTLSHETELDERLPLIYQYEVEDVDLGVIARYIGKASGGASRPRNDYPNNVRRLLAGEHWHGNTSREYRTIHYCLATAVVRGRTIRATLIQNVPLESIDASEGAARLERGQFCRCPGHVAFGAWATPA